jgi:hypothetical protein
MKTIVIDRRKLEAIANDIHMAIEQVGLKHGVVLRRGRGKFSNGPTGSLVIDIAARSADGTVMTRERKEYLDWGRMYDLKPEWLDRSFIDHGTAYTIVGLDGKRRKYPVVCQSGRDRTFNFAAAAVVAAMGGK